MAQPYIGEIRMFAGNFAPAGWMFCDGQLLSKIEYSTLFNLIGTIYGGDASNFALPDLRGRIPIHEGNGFTLAQPGGAEKITLEENQLASHTHALIASTDSGNLSSEGNYLAAGQDVMIYCEGITSFWIANSLSVSSTGGSQPHNNIMPYLCMNYIISLYGIIPSET